MRVKKQQQYGFSLIELMIAMVIGLTLMAGVISVFASTRKSFDLNEEMSAMQENARFAIDQLVSDIRMSGYQGCADLNFSAANVVAVNAPTTDYAATAIRGAEISGTTWSPSRPAELNGINPAPKSFSDVLMLQFGSAEAASLSGAGMSNPSSSITLAVNSDGLQADDLAIISDCNGADLFTITGVAGTTLQHEAGKNLSGALTMAYKPGATTATDRARVMRFNFNTYYVADTGRTNTEGEPIHALYVADLDTLNNDEDSLELIEGVENMQVLYGMTDTNGNIRYLAADNPALDTARVHSVQIALLLQSIENTNDEEDTRNYVLLDETISTDSSTGGPTHEKDKRMRMTFATTIKIRNRSPL